ncbi:MAG TPA: hypothetical protein VGQ52_18545 [Gemmatimonadaceae bacterium]|jgi:hypothetical protein|nr:hypothetical protein [Gemmatimonadaceae bacterium]
MATLNRWIANAMLWFGLVLTAIGGFFGLFGGMNDGLWAGVKLLLIPGLVAAALVGGSFAFRMAEQAHATVSLRRWAIQGLAIAITIIAIMLSMYAMSLLDRAIPA